MRCFPMAILLFALLPFHASAQILNVAELSLRDIEQLDREKTVVVMPGGLFEEHGPYLPSFTDAYLNEWLADRTAEAIVAKRGDTVLKFPIIPLGAGSPEDFGGLAPFSGSYTVRPDTLRAVYMDLASALGQDGFRTIFVFNRHGAPSHNRALLDAAAYFNDRFDGRMVVLTSLIFDETTDPPNYLDSDERRENGVDVHAGEWETSQTLFLQPQLVHDDYRTAAPATAASPEVLSEVATKPGWRGYFGSPRLATAKGGAQWVDYRTRQTIDLALRILDGFDWRSLPTRADPGSFRIVDDNTIARAEEERRRQEKWISATAK
jgi:creatinine amidohydrolase/Fe(II)-dependent formamide hydrolase-like protein